MMHIMRVQILGYLRSFWACIIIYGRAYILLFICGHYRTH